MYAHTFTNSRTHTHTQTHLQPSLTNALPVQFQLCPILYIYITSVQPNPCT
uniref:Uncharacterized protein n=1 Tax=Anguilla anguilla TaxID=7936 RepID=A0A0E9U3T8_ANGAN